MLYVLRISGEITIKSPQVRASFQRRLAQNLHAALASVPAKGSLKQDGGRLLLESAHTELAPILTRIFGIQSVSPVDTSCPAVLSDIVETGTRLYTERVQHRTFAVQCRRTGSHAFSSLDVNQHLGAALRADNNRADLSNPQVPIGVEVRNEQAHFFHDTLPGPGGLPLGTGGRATCLISGGFDSAAAAWMLMKRGVELNFVFCNVASAAYEASVVEVTRLLVERWAYGINPRFYAVPFFDVVKNLKESVQPRFVQVILKRLFYRAAEKIAARTESLALVTGEAIGQVSSQTLMNLRAIDMACTRPVLRPLISFDKHEIIALCRKIGTATLSGAIEEYCQLLPQKPSTHTNVKIAQYEEEKCDLGILDAAVEQATCIELIAPPQAKRSCWIEEIPENGVLLDCRTEDEYQIGHLEGAQWCDFYQWMEAPPAIEAEKTYVFYCDRGLQSVLLAEHLRKKGFSAFAWKI